MYTPPKPSPQTMNISITPQISLRSLIIPSFPFLPSPVPGNNWSIFYQVIDLHILDLLYKWKYTIYILLYLASFTEHNALHIYSSVYNNNFCMFVFTAEQCSVVQMYQSLFNYWPAEGNVSCFQFGTIRNKAAMNMHA